MDVFAALADPIRRDLLIRLRRGPARVVDLAEEHPVSRPAISRHLRILRDAHLVEVSASGRERHYSLHAEPLAEVDDLVRRLTARAPLVGPSQLDALDTEVRRTSRDRRRSDGALRPSPTSQEQTA